MSYHPLSPVATPALSYSSFAPPLPWSSRHLLIVESWLKRSTQQAHLILVGGAPRGRRRRERPHPLARALAMWRRVAGA
eukprot:191062-Pyramimonas_sp.AAC.1